jgi:hypothetical protein
MNVELTTRRAQQLQSLPYHVQERILTEHERVNKVIGLVIDHTLPDSHTRLVHETLCRVICDSQGGAPSAVLSDANSPHLDQIRTYLTGIMSTDYGYPVILLSYLENIEERTVNRRVVAYSYARRFDPISDYVRTWKERTKEALGFDPVFRGQDTTPELTV